MRPRQSTKRSLPRTKNEQTSKNTTVSKRATNLPAQQFLSDDSHTHSKKKTLETLKTLHTSAQSHHATLPALPPILTPCLDPRTRRTPFRRRQRLTLGRLPHISQLPPTPHTLLQEIHLAHILAQAPHTHPSTATRLPSPPSMRTKAHPTRHVTYAGNGKPIYARRRRNPQPYHRVHLGSHDASPEVLLRCASRAVDRVVQHLVKVKAPTTKEGRQRFHESVRAKIVGLRVPWVMSAANAADSALRVAEDMAQRHPGVMRRGAMKLAGPTYVARILRLVLVDM